MNRRHRRARTGRGAAARGLVVCFVLALGAGCGESDERGARSDLEGRRDELGQRLDEIAERAAGEIAFGVRLIEVGPRADEVRAALLVDADLSENEAQTVVESPPSIAAMNMMREEAEALVAKLTALGARVELIEPAEAPADGQSTREERVPGAGEPGASGG